MSYYEQFKYNYLLILKRQYVNASITRDEDSKSKVLAVIKNNKRLRDFQKKEFIDILNDKKTIR